MLIENLQFEILIKLYIYTVLCGNICHVYDNMMYLQSLTVLLNAHFLIPENFGQFFF